MGNPLRKSAVTAVALIAVAATGAEARQPFRKSGIANCALPGTTIEFAMDGRGGATLASFSSNYAGFHAAAKRRRWTAILDDSKGYRLLIFDNGANSRIMVRLPDGKGMAFTADGGVSDILCQVLVSP